MGNRLFVSNLSWNVDDDGLHDAFEKYGEVVNCRVITDRETERSRGFGFVTFATDEEAEAAIEMDGTSIDGRDVRVDWAHDKPRRGGGDRDHQSGGGHNHQDDDRGGGNHW